MKNLIFAIIATFLSLCSFGQVIAPAAPYNFAAGARAGFLTAGTAKYFLLEQIALEGIVGIRSFQGPHASILAEYHISNVFNIENMYMFFGGGANIGYAKRTKTDLSGISTTVSSGYTGLEGIFGFEYNFTQLIDFPLSASIDVRPGFDVYPSPRPIFGATGISIRYIFS
jgi:hypothetical protein